LPLPWVCQKTPSLPWFSRICCHGLEGVVDAQVLVVLGDQLDQPARDFLKQGEVLDEVQQRAGSQGRAGHRLQRDDALLALAVDLLPLVEVLPAGGHAAQAGLAAVGQDDEGVVPEEVRDGVLVVAQVAGRRRLQAACGRLSAR
jgi:hypothetical protein